MKKTEQAENQSGGLSLTFGLLGVLLGLTILLLFQLTTLRQSCPPGDQMDQPMELPALAFSCCALHSLGLSK